MGAPSKRMALDWLRLITPDYLRDSSPRTDYQRDDKVDAPCADLMSMLYRNQWRQPLLTLSDVRSEPGRTHWRTKTPMLQIAQKRENGWFVSPILDSRCKKIFTIIVAKITNCIDLSNTTLIKKDKFLLKNIKRAFITHVFA